MGELLIMTPLSAYLSPRGHFVLTAKFASGMQAYAERWSGPVTAMVRLVESPDTNMDHEEIVGGKYSFRVEARPTTTTELHARMRQATVVLGDSDVVDGARQVLLKETSIRTKWQINRANVKNPLRRFKRHVDIALNEISERRAITRVSGLQCNGTPTFDAYRDHNPRTLLYFDSRVHSQDLVGRQQLDARLERLSSGAPLRLVFSGRLIRIKGVNAIPRIAEELRRLGIRFTFDICGGGACEVSIRQELAQRGLDRLVNLRGVLKFREELLPLLRESADLFVCPHVQGDPSCTYIETLACGVPIVGYANEAWAGMCRLSRAGWTTPMRRPMRLAEQIARLSGDRSEIARASLLARDFAAENLFEDTMDARVAHLLSCVSPTPSPIG